MKKKVLFIPMMLFFIINSYSQASFNTGALRIDVSEYGRIQLYTTAGIQQLERGSLLVGTSPTTVFDYQNDANTLDPTILVLPPSISDFEIYGSYDNSYSGDPPDVIETLNAYGWTNGGYSIVKFNVTNSGTTSYNASTGLDLIPYLNETYGFDSVTYNSAAGVIRFHRGTDENMGVKLLSDTLSSLYSFEWYDGYTVDTSYWNWMHYGSLQSEYASNTVDGPVTITSQSAVTLAPGASYNVYYAFALGADEATLLANIAAAEEKYESVFVSVQNIDPSANAFYLGQNSPNPFNQSTTISYKLPEDGFVSLRVYNAVGNEVAVLVNSDQTRGSHTVQFNANGLPGGMYYYTLRFNDQVRSNKMSLVK
jgi:hypothetical protein